MKLVCYLQCGLGDFYDLLSMLPAFIQQQNIEKRDIKFYIDSIYFTHQQFHRQKLAAVKMMETITNNWEVVPMGLGSYNDLYYGPHNSDRPLGPRYEKIKNTFMFYRNKVTIDYMKSKIDSNTIFVYSIMGANFTFEWKDGTNIPFKYQRQPLQFQRSKEVELPSYSVLVHVRKKGRAENSVYFNRLFDMLHQQNLEVGCIDLDGVKKPEYVKDFSVFSFEDIIYLIENIKYMISSSSMFGYHRLHFNKETIICTPERLGANESIFQKEDLGNSKYLFLNSDIDNLQRIKERVSRWNK